MKLRYIPDPIPGYPEPLFTILTFDISKNDFQNLNPRFKIKTWATFSLIALPETLFGPEFDPKTSKKSKKSTVKVLKSSKND